MISHNDLVELIRSAAVEVFTTMLALTPEQGEPYRSSGASLSTNGVVSLIGLAGPWVGTGSILCSAHCACELASRFMMSQYEAVDDEVLDAMAEITNMILGNVKTALDDMIGPLGLSIPTVIYGRNFSSRTVSKQEWTVVPFHIGQEKIDIQICLAPNRDNSRPRQAPPVVQAVEV